MPMTFDDAKKLVDDFNRWKPDEPAIRKAQMRRLVLVEEGMNRSVIELIASGDIDESHLEAIDGFVRRQRDRLAKQPPAPTDVPV